MSDLRDIIRHAREDMSAITPQAAGRFSQPETTVEDKRSLFGKAADFLMDKFLPEVGDMLVQKIAQGSGEIAQGLNADSNFYVPYGAAQSPLEIEGPTMSFIDRLHDVPQEPDRGIGR